MLGFTLHAYLVHESTQALTIGAAVLAGTYAVLTFWIKNSSSAFSSCKSFSFSRLHFCLNFPACKRSTLDSNWLGCSRYGFNCVGVTERYRLSRYIGVVLVLLSSIALFYQVWANEEFPTLSTSIYAIAQFISAFYLLQYNSKSNAILAQACLVAFSCV